MEADASSEDSAADGENVSIHFSSCIVEQVKDLMRQERSESVDDGDDDDSAFSSSSQRH
jgi:hypothetical protein